MQPPLVLPPTTTTTCTCRTSPRRHAAAPKQYRLQLQLLGNHGVPNGGQLGAHKEDDADEQDVDGDGSGDGGGLRGVRDAAAQGG